MPRLVGALVLIGGFAFGAYQRGYGWLALPLGVLTVIWLLTMANLIVDDEELVVAPLVPVLPRQRFRFEDLGPFFAPEKYADRDSRSRGGFARVRAEILRGRSYRSLSLIPLRTVTLSAFYGAAPWGPPLAAPELAAAIEGRRRVFSRDG